MLKMDISIENALHIYNENIGQHVLQKPIVNPKLSMIANGIMMHIGNMTYLVLLSNSEGLVLYASKFPTTGIPFSFAFRSSNVLELTLLHHK